MLFIFSTPVLIRHLWQLKTVVFLLWCLISAVLLINLEHWQHLFRVLCNGKAALRNVKIAPTRRHMSIQWCIMQHWVNTGLRGEGAWGQSDQKWLIFEKQEFNEKCKNVLFQSNNMILLTYCISYTVKVLNGTAHFQSVIYYRGCHWKGIAI